MRARGYGAGRGRTTFSLFRFRRVDALALGALVCLLAASVWGMALCLRGFAFYPVLAWPALSPLWYAPYALLLFFPLLVQCREVF